MGVTSDGYIRRTYDEVINNLIQTAKQVFGEDIDVSDQGAVGKFLRIIAYELAIIEEDGEAIYYSIFPNTATGQSLDRLFPFAAISRNAAEAASYSVKFTGTAGTLIPVGFLVGTDTELEFYTVEDATIGEDGTCTATVECTEAGIVGNTSPGAINNIVNPDVNISAVEGQECLSAGVDEESDVDGRARFHSAISGAGSCNANAIRAALLRVPTVQFAAVVENEEDTADEDGRPPHSFECYVLGGDDYEQEIAEAIFEKRPIGVKTTGDKSVTITDASGSERAVYYSAAQNVRVTVKAQITTDATFAGDGSAAVQTSVANYINGLGIGKSLVLSTIYGYIYKIPGVVEVTDLQLSTDGGSTYSTDNVAVPKYGVAVCAGVNVEVNA